jgi:hypothetical protein
MLDKVLLHGQGTRGGGVKARAREKEEAAASERRALRLAQATCAQASTWSHHNHYPLPLTCLQCSVHLYFCHPSTL